METMTWHHPKRVLCFSDSPSTVHREAPRSRISPNNSSKEKDVRFRWVYKVLLPAKSHLQAQLSPFVLLKQPLPIVDAPSAHIAQLLTPNNAVLIIKLLIVAR